MKILDSAKATLPRARQRAPWFDHLVRALGRYKRDSGDRLAASLTFYAFLSLFPLLLLGISVLGFTLSGREELQTRIFGELVQAIPGLADTFEENLDTIRDNAGKTGIVALVGVLIAGLGGVTALRDSLRLMWHQNPAEGNFITSRLSTAVSLLGLGLTLMVSVALSAIASSLLKTLLRAVGLGTGPVATTVGTVATVALTLGADVLLFLYLFRRLPKVDWPFRRVLHGAIFGAVGFGLLKFGATFYVARTVSNSSNLYGPVGAVIGILIGINLIARFVLFTAAWTVTAPGSDDVLPSATASPAAAARAGGTASPDGPATSDPRFPAAEPQPERPRASVAALIGNAEARLEPTTVGRTRMAAGVVLGAAGAGVAVVAVKGARTIWDTVRSG
ncbi:MAG TPA: YihY/virulence factor BrkB family protein [Mycobacteriales bacterium]|nr:YihY/virulence factor BrkB family protein [Mycobacteriales bacterium]